MANKPTKTYDNNNRPKVSVFRSNRFISVQVIDIETGNAIFGMTSKSITDKITPVEKAGKLGKMIAEKAKEMKIASLTFDRNNKRYHGQIAALADGIREGGLNL